MRIQREEIVEKIISAKTKEDAVSAIKLVLEAMDISTDYAAMERLSRGLQELTDQVKEQQNKYKGLPKPRNYEEVQNIRTETNFIYREIVDDYSRPIILAKKLLENQKDDIKEQAIKWVSENPEYSTVPPSKIETYKGAAPMYKQWAQEDALAYTNYKFLESTLDTTKSFIDSLASELRHLGVVEKYDVK